MSICRFRFQGWVESVRSFPYVGRKFADHDAWCLGMPPPAQSDRPALMPMKPTATIDADQLVNRDASDHINCRIRQKSATALPAVL